MSDGYILGCDAFDGRIFWLQYTLREGREMLLELESSLGRTILMLGYQAESMTLGGVTRVAKLVVA